MKDFRDKVVVITGGATGIGFSFAKQFGKEGATVHIAGIRPERVEQSVQALQAMGHAASGSVCDVRDREQIEALANHTWETYGHVDVIVNNAGVPQAFSSVIDMPREQVDQLFAVNFFGVWAGTSVFGKRFIEQGSPAAIYNVGSENSFFNAVPNTSAYIASKHGVFAITEALREEVPEFIDVGLIIPGFVQSEMGEDMSRGMDTDKFTGIALEQMKAGEFYIVSHAYNAVRIHERFQEVFAAYEKYAPRYDGDDEFDVRTLFAKLGLG